MDGQRLLIHGGEVVFDGKSQHCDVLIADGKIAAIGNSIPLDGIGNTIDATDCIVTYGLADVHVHLREPGYSYKETIASGSKAAAHGGYTIVCAMPNLNPAPDTIETLAIEQEIIKHDALIDVRPYAPITLSRNGRTVVDVEKLASHVVGFSDDGSGVQDENIMREAMQRATETDSIIVAHCEDNSLLCGGYIHDGDYAHINNHRGISSESEWRQVARDVEIAKETGCRYHVCHISTAESVDIIRNAKASGGHITCETAPHYLVLTDNDLQDDGRFKMNPPLRTHVDRDALILGLQDGTIEVIATDHAPHTTEEKSRGLKDSAMGIVGLETAFAILYTELVRKGKISLEHLFKLMCDNPRRIFRLGGSMNIGEVADIAIFDIKTPYKIDSKQFFSMGHATPFDGHSVYGQCILTLKNGRIVWKKGQR